MLYERLNDEMRSMVDTYARELRSMSWSACTNVLSGAVAPFSDCYGETEARLAARAFLTAVLERMEPQAVIDPDQALLLSQSLNPSHRALAEAYLASVGVHEPEPEPGDAAAAPAPSTEPLPN